MASPLAGTDMSSPSLVPPFPTTTGRLCQTAGGFWGTASWCALTGHDAVGRGAWTTPLARELRGTDKWDHSDARGGPTEGSFSAGRSRRSSCELAELLGEGGCSLCLLFVLAVAV